MDPDKRTAWLRQLDRECPYQVVLPRRQLADDSEILNFLLRYAGKFDMYVEDDYAAFVRYCFEEDPLDAEIFAHASSRKPGVSSSPAEFSGELTFILHNPQPAPTDIHWGFATVPSPLRAADLH